MTVYWLDRELAVAKIRAAAIRLARQRPEIQRIVLFGSLARGDAVPGSDADILLVISESKRNFLDRIPQYFPSGCDFAVDVFPYTEDEFNQMVREGNPFVRTAVAEGVVLFERQQASA